MILLTTWNVTSMQDPDAVLLSIFSHSSDMTTFSQLLNTEGRCLLSPYFCSEYPKEPWLAWSRPLAALLAMFLYHQWLAQSGWLSIPVTRCWAYDGVISSPQQSHRGTCSKGAGCQDTVTNSSQSCFRKVPSALSYRKVISVSQNSCMTMTQIKTRKQNKKHIKMHTHRGAVDLEWSQTIFIIFKQHHFWGF